MNRRRLAVQDTYIKKQEHGRRLETLFFERVAFNFRGVPQ